MPDGTATAKAIEYSLKRWVALTRFIDNGDLAVDNNRVERLLRPIARGRNNVKRSLMRTRTRRRAIPPSVNSPDCDSATSHDHSDCRNCISPLGRR